MGTNNIDGHIVVGVLRFRVRHGVREKQCMSATCNANTRTYWAYRLHHTQVIRQNYSAVKQDHHTLNMQLHYLVIYCYHNTCFRLSLFSGINVSQGSAATLAWCCGIFNAYIVANFLFPDIV